MLVVHATGKLLARLGKPTTAPATASTTALGSWYATAIFWRPQVALFVNQSTLLPVFLPLAPAGTLLDRFPDAVAQVLTALGADRRFVDAERAAMHDHQVVKTADRSTVGMLTEFAWLADVHTNGKGTPDLLPLSVQLAHTPCGPLHDRTGFPDLELAAVVAARGDSP